MRVCIGISVGWQVGVGVDISIGNREWLTDLWVPEFFS